MEPPAGKDEEVKPEAVTSTAGAGADPGNLGSDESEGLECMGTTEDMIKNSGGKPPPPPRIREGKKGKSGNAPDDAGDGGVAEDEAKGGPVTVVYNPDSVDRLITRGTQLKAPQVTAWRQD